MKLTRKKKMANEKIRGTDAADKATQSFEDTDRAMLTLIKGFDPK
jgi:hypothetical protein